MSNILLTSTGACIDDPLCLDGEFTIDFWFKVEDAEQEGVLFRSADPHENANCDGLLIAYVGSGEVSGDLDNDGTTNPDSGDRGIFFNIAKGSGCSYPIAAHVRTADLQAGVWHHFALTRDLNNMVRAFWNGKFLPFLTKPACIYIPMLPPPTVIGDLSLNGSTLSGAPFDLCGSIDELRIIKGVAHWCEDFTPPICPHDCIVPANCDPSLGGCIDPTANNFNPLATWDNGGCQAGGGGSAAASSEDSSGTTTGTYAISNGATDYYYWHLEDISKRAVSLAAPANHTDYHAWNYTEDGENVDLYVIDTGVNAAHPMLQAHTGGSRVNDVPGYNGMWNGSVYTNDDANGHGTYCSLFAGGGVHGVDDPVGHYGPGVAKKLNIWRLRVADINGTIMSSDMLAAINAVVAHNTVGGANYKNTTRASVINFSLGLNVPNSSNPVVYENVQGTRNDAWDAVNDALKQAAFGNSGTNAEPVHVVMAAGNGFDNGGYEIHGPMEARYNYGAGSQDYPTFDGTGTATFATNNSNNDPGQGLPICSGGTKQANINNAKELETYYRTNYGSAITIFAPGQNLVCPLYNWVPGNPGGPDFGAFTTTMSGTSFSSPITAGLLALRLSDKNENPAATKTWLTDSVAGGGNADQIDGPGISSNGLMTPVNCPGVCTGNGPLKFGLNYDHVTLITGINHGLVVGNVIQINGVTATPTSGTANEVWPGNVTADQINGWHTITTAGTDHVIFKITGLNPTDVGGNVGGPNAQYAKVTGTHEANDGVVGQGSTLELVPDTGSNVNIKYTPVTYSNNLYLYNPYQTYVTSWTQAETLTSVAKDAVVCLALNATMTITNSIGGSAPAASGPLNETPFPTVMTFDSGTLPTGLTYVPSTGVLAGTATTAGTYTFTMAATNGYWNAKRRFTLIVT